MGLFRKKEKPVSNINENFFNFDTPKFEPIVIPEPVLPPDPPARPSLTYETIEKKIASNPLAALYRLPVQQERARMSSVSWARFKTVTKGRFIVMDLETTGLNPEDDAIVQVGIAKVDQGEIIDEYCQLVNPNTSIPEAASRVHGFTDKDVENQPYIFEVIPDILDFMENEIIVSHNAAFDLKFFFQACMRYRFRIPATKYFDSMDLSEVWPGLKNRKLETFLAAAEIVNEKPHDALSDARSLARLMIASMQKKTAAKKDNDE